MLARLSKTLSTNLAVAGLTALVLGAGGTTATLVSSHPNDHASDTAKQQVTENADKPGDTSDADENDSSDSDSGSADDQGTRPTDTHGYCVSQIAQAAPAAPTGTGADTVNHGSLVSAAAKACGKDHSTSGSDTSAPHKAAAAAHAAKGKAHAHHATGKPTG